MCLLKKKKGNKFGLIKEMSPGKYSLFYFSTLGLTALFYSSAPVSRDSEPA